MTTWAKVIWNWEYILRNWLAHSYSLFFSFSFSSPLPFWELLPFVFVSLKLPTRQKSTAALYQLETRPCPISMASPGENLETGPWNRWQREALTNLRCVYWELVSCFLLGMKGYYLLTIYFDVEQIRQSEDRVVDTRLHMSNWLSRKLSWVVHRKTSNISTELASSSHFPPPKSNGSLKYVILHSHIIKSYFVTDRWYTLRRLLTECVLKWFASFLLKEKALWHCELISTPRLNTCPQVLLAHPIPG